MMNDFHDFLLLLLIKEYKVVRDIKWSGNFSEGRSVLEFAVSLAHS